MHYIISGGMQYCVVRVPLSFIKQKIKAVSYVA